MSAWFVSKDHVDALVTGARTLGVAAVLPADSGDVLGRRLWRENLHSVSSRYPSDNWDESRLAIVDYRYSPFIVPPAVLLKSIHCYRYQSCEHAGWDNSWAELVTAQMEAALEARHGSLLDKDGRLYNESPWGLDREHRGTFADA